MSNVAPINFVDAQIAAMSRVYGRFLAGNDILLRNFKVTDKGSIQLGWGLAQYVGIIDLLIILHIHLIVHLKNRDMFGKCLFAES